MHNLMSEMRFSTQRVNFLPEVTTASDGRAQKTFSNALKPLYYTLYKSSKHNI